MTTKHTPGPWTLTRNLSRIEVKVDALRSYAFTHDDEANARLIAAAPDLLAALEEAEYCLRLIHGEPEYEAADMDAGDRAILQARAAIAKAKA